MEKVGADGLNLAETPHKPCTNGFADNGNKNLENFLFLPCKSDFRDGLGENLNKAEESKWTKTRYR